MSPHEWERLLLDATAKVKELVADISRSGERGRTVGIGAAGDKTIYADRAAEAVLLKSIESVEGTKVLSEEAGFKGPVGGKTLAVVDPLDGSSNFERGIPFYCTSIAIVAGQGIDDITVGVVRDLVTGDVYHAVKGGGAKKNGVPITSSGTVSVPDAVIGVDLSRGTSALVSGLSRLISHARRQVHFGANALELCYVGDRTIDAFVDLRGSIRITDLAAAYLVASEAGAVITGADGKKLTAAFDFEHRFSFVASANEALHKEILELCGPPRGRA